MQKRCENSENEYHSLVDEYASEYLEAEKIKKAREELKKINDEMVNF